MKDKLRNVILGVYLYKIAANQSLLPVTNTRTSTRQISKSKLEQGMRGFITRRQGNKQKRADKSYKRLSDCNEEMTLKLMSIKTCFIESQEKKVLRHLGSMPGIK